MTASSHPRLTAVRAGIGLLAAVLGSVALSIPACSAKEDAATDSSALHGRWSGTKGVQKRPVAFDLEENRGAIAGTFWLADPKTGDLLDNGELTGKREGSHLEFSTATGLVVQGTMDGGHFVGTMTYPPWEDIPGITLDVVLERESQR